MLRALCVSLVGLTPMAALAGGESTTTYTTYDTPTPVIVSTATPAQVHYVSGLTIDCCCNTVTVGGFAFTTRGSNDKMMVFN